MIVDNHVSTNSLKLFLAGKLSASQRQQVMTHLAYCDQCMQRSERLFNDFEVVSSWAPPIELPPATQLRVRRRLFAQLNRSDLSGQILRFSTAGLIHVMLNVLRLIPRRPTS